MSAKIVLALPILVCPAIVQASPMVTHSQFLPSPSSIFAPTPDFTSNGIATTVTPGDPEGVTYVGLTQSYSQIAKSPFEGISGYENTPYDAVTGGGSACFGLCSAGLLSSAALNAASIGGSPSYSFIYGSPDTYNTLTIYSTMGVYTFRGADLTVPNFPSSTGYEFVTISGIGTVSGAEVQSYYNSVEFAAVSYVPLPAAAPMFGAALMALGVVGYGVKRRKATIA